jgi:hypothetical protein
MYFVQLIYASRIKQENFDQNTVKQIQDVALKFNQKNNVSGVLFCDGSYFLQALEGSRSKVSALYNKIAKDERHQDVTLLAMNDIAVRDFGDWSMELLSYKAETIDVLKRFTVANDFNPFLLSSESSKELLRCLAMNQTTERLKNAS